jgi:hypothetical protein
LFVGRNGSALNTNTVGTDGVGGINGNLVVGFNAVLKTEVKVFDVYI